MPKPELHTLKILQTSDVFAELSESVLRKLSAEGRVERFDKRTLLAPRTQMATHLRYVVQGSVEFVISTAAGVEAGLPPIMEGDWATWLGAFYGKPLTHDMWSSSAAVYVSFPVRAVRTAVESSPAALTKVIEHIGARTRALMQWTTGFTLSSPERRLALAVLSTSDGRSPAAEKVGYSRMTQEQLGRLGFGTRQRVARLLRRLADDGLIEMKYGRVEIPSRSRLMRFATGKALT